MSEYWKFVKGIWQNPTDYTRRLIFADWLDDNRMHKAARSQRHAAKVIRETKIMIYFVRIEHIFGMHNRAWWRMKKDSRLVFSKSSVRLTIVKPYHFLKGKFLDLFVDYEVSNRRWHGGPTSRSHRSGTRPTETTLPSGPEVQPDELYSNNRGHGTRSDL